MSLNYLAHTLLENAASQHLHNWGTSRVDDGVSAQLEAAQHITGVPYIVLVRCITESCLASHANRIAMTHATAAPDLVAADPLSVLEENGRRYPLRIRTCFVEWVRGYIKYTELPEGPFDARLRQFLRAVLVAQETIPHLWNGWRDTGMRADLAEMISQRLTLTEQAQAREEAAEKIKADADTRDRAAEAAREAQRKAEARAARRAARKAPTA